MRKILTIFLGLVLLTSCMNNQNSSSGNTSEISTSGDILVSLVDNKFEKTYKISSEDTLKFVLQ